MRYSEKDLDRRLAKLLHARDKPNYPDDNHKPELACAVTEFEGLCGFRKLNEIVENVGAVPELKELIGEDTVKLMETSLDNDAQSRAEALKQAFNMVMSSSEDRVKQQASKMVDRLKSSQKLR